MKINVDLTGALFSDLKLVSFYDSKTLFFQPPRELPSSLSFEVWGADILPTFPWGDFLSNEEIKTFENRLSEPPDRVTVGGLVFFPLRVLREVFALCPLETRLRLMAASSAWLTVKSFRSRETGLSTRM